MPDPTNPSDADAQAAALRHENELLRLLVSTLSSSRLPLVRAERVEIVDRRGRTQVVIGDLAGVDDRTVGVAIYDRRGSERITLAIGDAGPLLGFSLDGDGALVLGVDDIQEAAVRPGPYVELLAPDGDIAIGWRVNADTAELELEGLDPVRDPET